jgi:hypothetical protein
LPFSKIAPFPPPLKPAKFHFRFGLVRFGSVWFGLVRFGLTSPFPRFGEAELRLSTLNSQLFPISPLVLRLQSAALQLLANDPAKKCKNFSFGAAIPRYSSLFDSAALNSQPFQTLNLEP